MLRASAGGTHKCPPSLCKHIILVCAESARLLAADASVRLATAIMRGVRLATAVMRGERCAYLRADHACVRLVSATNVQRALRASAARAHLVSATDTVCGA